MAKNIKSARQELKVQIAARNKEIVRLHKDRYKNYEIGAMMNPVITGQRVGQILGSIVDCIAISRAKSRIPTLGKARKIK
jgi:hypothetical protein